LRHNELFDFSPGIAHLVHSGFGSRLSAKPASGRWLAGFADRVEKWGQILICDIMLTRPK
jgi:hypothetical protein